MTQNDHINEDKNIEEIKRKIEHAKRTRKAILEKKKLETMIMDKTEEKSHNSSTTSNRTLSESENNEETVPRDLPKKKTIRLQDIEKVSRYLNLELRYNKVDFEHVFSRLKFHACGDMEISIRQAMDFFRE